MILKFTIFSLFCFIGEISQFKNKQTKRKETKILIKKAVDKPTLILKKKIFEKEEKTNLCLYIYIYIEKIIN